METTKLEKRLWRLYFGTTLVGAAARWLGNLPRETATNYERLRRAFLLQFGKMADAATARTTPQQRGPARGTTEEAVRRTPPEHVNRNSRNTVFVILNDDDPFKQTEGKRITSEEVKGMVYFDGATRQRMTGEEDDDRRCKPKGTTSLTGERTGNNERNTIGVYNPVNRRRKNRSGDDPLIIHGYILKSATISIYIDTGSATKTMKKSSF